MYRIELYGIGHKNGNEIKAIVGVCYVTEIKGRKNIVENNILERKDLQKGMIMNIATINNFIITGSGANIISSTLNTPFGKATVFGIRLNEIVSNDMKDKFVKYMKAFPTVATAFMR